MSPTKVKNAPPAVWEALLELVPCGVFLSFPSERLFHFNRRFAELWRMPDLATASASEDTLRKVAQQALHGDEFIARIEKNHRGSGGGDFVTLRDGSTIECRVAPIRLADRRDGTVSVFTELETNFLLQGVGIDGTRREPANRLASALAHDFNNVFTIIQGYVDLLLSNGQKSPPQAEGLKHITSATRRAMKLIQQLQCFGQPAVVQRTVVNVNDVALAAVGRCQAVYGRAPKVHLNLSPAWPRTQADRALLDEVIGALLANAVDAVPSEQGKILLRTSIEEIEHPHDPKHNQAGEFVCIAVQDNGCGMDDSTRTRIFEPFFTTRKGAGRSGLGLPRALGMVNLMGGWIDVASQCGRGSTFSVFLRHAPGALAPEVASADGPLQGSETVLVVEWDELLRALLRQILEGYGYKVMESASSAYAFELWSQHRNDVDLVLTDVSMPGGMSGPNLAQQIWKVHPGFKTLFVSGHTWDSVQHNFGLKNEHSFLQKPFDSITLARAVRRCLDHEADLDRAADLLHHYAPEPGRQPELSHT